MCFSIKVGEGFCGFTGRVSVLLEDGGELLVGDGFICGIFFEVYGVVGFFFESRF